MTDLQVDRTLLVDPPMPGLSRHALEPGLLSPMRATGQRFASNLHEQLGLDSATVSVIEVPEP